MAKGRIPPLMAVVIVIGVGAVYAVAVLPLLQNSGAFNALDPLSAYVLYNVGFILLFSGFLGTIITAALRQKYDIVHVLSNGAVSFFVFSFTFDLLQGPFFLSPQGQPIISKSGGTLVNTSVDAMLAYVYHDIFGVAYSPTLYYLVYGLTPVLAIMAAVFALGPRRLVHVFSGGAR